MKPTRPWRSRWQPSSRAILRRARPCCFFRATGHRKTRLVRAILAAMSARKADSAQVLYTADTRALENDEIFVDFLTGNHDAFVIEDADHLLMARSNGNVDLHRFLAVADGVVRAQGRKIIFTTNLPNIGDIDEALVRPGRCFATVRTRALERYEQHRCWRGLQPRALNEMNDECSGVGSRYALDHARSVVSAGGFRG